LKGGKAECKGGHIKWPPSFLIKGYRYLIVIDCEKVASEFGRILKFNYLTKPLTSGGVEFTMLRASSSNNSCSDVS
jgi:hypothetical protein